LRSRSTASTCPEHNEAQRVSIGARLTVRTDAGAQSVTPFITSAGNGFASTPVPLQGVDGAAVSIAGINAGAGRVRLQVSGVGGGVAKRAVLHKGETLSYRGVAIRFDDFDLSDFDPQAGKINIGVVFKVTDPSGKVVEAEPRFRGGEEGEIHEDAAVPGLPGVMLRVGRMDPNEKTVETEVLDPSAPGDPGEPMKFSVDVTIKPMIGLLWTGLVVLLAGGILAVIRRGEEFSTAVAAQPTSGT
jgi:cytochrome c-type biogenesis protein CcmF